MCHQARGGTGSDSFLQCTSSSAMPGPPTCRGCSPECISQHSVHSMRKREQQLTLRQCQQIQLFWIFVVGVTAAAASAAALVQPRKPMPSAVSVLSRINSSFVCVASTCFGAVSRAEPSHAGGSTTAAFGPAMFEAASSQGTWPRVHLAPPPLAPPGQHSEAITLSAPAAAADDGSSTICSSLADAAGCTTSAEQSAD